MTPRAPVPADPDAAWTDLYDEIRAQYVAATEIAAGLEGEGEDTAAADAKAAAFDAVLGLMDQMGDS